MFNRKIMQQFRIPDQSQYTPSYLSPVIHLAVTNILLTFLGKIYPKGI